MYVSFYFVDFWQIKKSLSTFSAIVCWLTVLWNWQGKAKRSHLYFANELTIF